MDPQSSFMFLVIVNEAFGYTHQQTLDSSFCTIVSMLKEYGYMQNERSRYYEKDDELKDGEEWIYVTDFVTGKPKKVKQVKSL